jgi:hypothetical protein
VTTNHVDIYNGNSNTKNYTATANTGGGSGNANIALSGNAMVANSTTISTNAGDLKYIQVADKYGKTSWYSAGALLDSNGNSIANVGYKNGEEVNIVKGAKSYENVSDIYYDIYGNSSKRVTY